MPRKIGLGFSTSLQRSEQISRFLEFSRFDRFSVLLSSLKHAFSIRSVTRTARARSAYCDLSLALDHRGGFPGFTRLAHFGLLFSFAPGLPNLVHAHF